ncbi:hypothetical protein ACHAXT_013292 [Thalassiosira profunda]
MKRSHAGARFLLVVAAMATTICLRRVLVFQSNVTSTGTNNGTAGAVGRFILEQIAGRSTHKSEIDQQRRAHARRAAKKVARHPPNMRSGNRRNTVPRPMDILPGKGLRDIGLQPSNITIHFYAKGAVYSIDYMDLASMWGRYTTYDDILSRATSNDASQPSSSSEAFQQKLQQSNITIIFHNSPKTASSTLRKACIETQHDTCNLQRKGETNKWPEGYRNPKRLAQLFGQCPHTFHYCVKELPLTKNYAQHYDTRTFLHMVPFRNYDAWSRSALHQISYRDGEEGCQRVDRALDACCTNNTCMSRSWELKPQRYGKSILAQVIGSFELLREMLGRETVDEHHHFLVHNYVDLHKSLRWLHKSCGVPLLPGTDENVNSVRPKDSCAQEERLMEKFHNCFSDQLAKMY